MIQQLKWDEKTNSCLIVTKYNDEVIAVEPATPEEAALWQAQHGY